jgi:TctA family transporter
VILADGLDHDKYLQNPQDSYKHSMPIIIILFVVVPIHWEISSFRCYVAVVFGVIGTSKKYGYPGAPLVLGVFGPIAREP